MIQSMTDSGGYNAAISVAAQYPATVVLLCTDQTIYLSKNLSVWSMDLNGTSPAPVGSAPISPWWKLAARFRPLRRLGRLDVRELLQLPNDGLLAIVQKGLALLDKGSEEFRPVFQIPDGGRPKGLVLTPAGRVYVGEYWGNPQRRSLRIWQSDDQGNTWNLAYRLPEKSAKHIHNLVWDQYRQGLWVLTGDVGQECALLFTGDDFKTVSEVVRGSQMFRACQIFCLPEGLYYGTDTEREKNWFVFLEPSSGKLLKIQELPGSCIYAARMADKYFIATAVEPSKVNYYKNTVLWSSTDLHQWSKMCEFEKDWWPGEYFQFGNVVLPRVQGECPMLVFSTVAVKHYDHKTFVIKSLL